MKTMLNVALPKGRLGMNVYDLFEKAGYPCPAIKEDNRKLIFENKQAGIRYFWETTDVHICGTRRSRWAWQERYIAGMSRRFMNFWI
ncbi:MAG: hypothetical protein ACLRWH_07065 [Emergencia sp.]